MRSVEGHTFKVEGLGEKATECSFARAAITMFAALLAQSFNILPHAIP
jgi:hypothetical protein